MSLQNRHHEVVKHRVLVIVDVEYLDGGCLSNLVQGGIEKVAARL